MSTPARLLLLLLACLLAIIASEISAATPLPFPIAAAQQQTLAEEQVLDGVVEAVNQSTVSAQTAGRVEEIMVDVNDFVPQGTRSFVSAISNNVLDWSRPKPICVKLKHAPLRLKPNTTGPRASTSGN